MRQHQTPCITLALLRVCLVFAVGLMLASHGILSACPQDGSATDIQRHAASGEFTLALQGANQLSGSQRDQALQQIAEIQSANGASYGAIQSASLIQDDQTRGQTFGSVAQPVNSNPMGGQGGITAADFSQLIQLIQNTIDPSSWDQDTASIRPYPAGVFVDANGALQRIPVDAHFDWGAVVGRSPSDSDSWTLDRQSSLRKVSLTRLARSLEMSRALGETPDPAAQHLAGIYRIEYVITDPTSGEIIIAGPAGPMAIAADGHWVNAATGQSVLTLDDLVECLRNAWTGGAKFGCSIDPRPENLAKASQFLSTTRLTNRAFRDGLRDSLGLQDINVFGIDPRSHAAQILVEADYLMKCIGLGVEPSIAEVPSYWDRLDFDNEQAPPALGIARWWFTMNYDAVVSNPQRTVFAIRGPGVKVQSEDELLEQNGNRVHTGQSNGATRSYAEDFTRHFDQLCRAKPCLAELRNVFDLALTGAIVADQIKNGRVDRSIEFFCATAGDDHPFVYQTKQLAAPKVVESVMNHRYYETRNNGRHLRHMVVAVGGGVEFDAQQVLQSVSKTAAEGSLESAVNCSAPLPADRTQWWWD